MNISQTKTFFIKIIFTIILIKLTLQAGKGKSKIPDEHQKTFKFNGKILPNNEWQIYNVSDSIQNGEECSICKESIKFNNLIVSKGNECEHHSFHKECITKWFEENIKPLCPTCKKIYFTEIPIEEPVFSNENFHYEYQILLDPLSYADANDEDNFIKKQIEFVDKNILGFILTHSPNPHPNLSMSMELGYARSKLATFDVEDVKDIGESSKNDKKKGN
uniref:RING-type domain-containing protein n=1 Tax=Meloidogyne hapla TaxID=6305 RepID=A0A1I8BB78_MELHA